MGDGFKFVTVFYCFFILNLEVVLGGDLFLLSFWEILLYLAIILNLVPFRPVQPTLDSWDLLGHTCIQVSSKPSTVKSIKFKIKYDKKNRWE